MYSVLISDIDNTLVPIKGNGSDIDADTVAMVTSSLQKGFHISVATGRGWESTAPVVQKLGLVDPCIIEGGSCIINPKTAHIIWQITMDAPTCNAVAQTFKKYAVSNELIKSSGKPERIAVKRIADYSFENRVIYLLGTDEQTAMKIKTAVDNLPLTSAHLTTPSWAGPELYDVHVTHKQGTKEHALSEWSRRMKTSKAETIALGDSANDLPLFKAAGLRIAVGNASSELKAAADYIAPDRIDGALRDVIEKYFLNPKS